MAFGLCRGNYGLSADVTHDGVNSSIDGDVGVRQSNLSLTGVTAAYSIGFEIAAGQEATLNPATGAVTGASSGVAQVETATVVAAGGCTSNGNLAVVVTMAGVAYPVTVPLTTATHTTATLIANAIAEEIASDAAIDAVYAATSVGAGVILTRVSPADNDTTLNIAITAGLGVSALVSSTDTTEGIGPTLIYRIAGQTYDAEDFQGKALAAITTGKGILISHTSGDTTITNDNDVWRDILSGVDIALRVSNAGGLEAQFEGGVITFTADTSSGFTVTVVGA